MLCKRTDYKSNREVFAKEYVILVQAEQNQSLCTYVYISLDVCKELLHFDSCGLRSLLQKVSSIHKTTEQIPPNGKEKSLSNVDKRLADSRRGPCTRSSFKVPQVSYICLLFLTCMFYFLTLPWLAHVSPGG